MYVLSTIKIREFAEEVLRLPVSMMKGEIDPDQVKVLLGELLDIWPASIFEEPDLSSLYVEPDVSSLMVEPDLSSLNVDLDLTILDADLGDLPAVMAELDKIDW